MALARVMINRATGPIMFTYLTTVCTYLTMDRVRMRPLLVVCQEAFPVNRSTSAPMGDAAWRLE